MNKNNRKRIKADIVEYDDNGNIIGYGSFSDYDYYAEKIQNGDGYYDKNGHYKSYDD